MKAVSPTEDDRSHREPRGLPGLGSPRGAAEGRGGGREANGRTNRGGPGRGGGREANGRMSRCGGGPPGSSRANGRGAGEGLWATLGQWEPEPGAKAERQAA